MYLASFGALGLPHSVSGKITKIIFVVIRELLVVVLDGTQLNSTQLNWCVRRYVRYVVWTYVLSNTHFFDIGSLSYMNTYMGIV